MMGCSSIKEPQQPLRLTDADSMLRNGLELESKGNYQDAGSYYRVAQGMYEEYAKMDGVLACLSGNCRISLLQNLDKSYLEQKEYMQEIIDEVSPELAYYMLLLKLFELQQSKDYASIAEIAVYNDNTPLSAKLQIATAKLQALAYQQSGTVKFAHEVENLAKAYNKQLRKKASGDADLLSSAWYAIAYYHYVNSAFRDAVSYLDKAISSDFRYGNTAGLGHDYWLMGQVEAKRGNRDKALACLRKAEFIFRSGDYSTALQGVTEEIYRLKGDTP